MIFLVGLTLKDEKINQKFFEYISQLLLFPILWLDFIQQDSD
jgi:hypothetical protein